MVALTLYLGKTTGGLNREQETFSQGRVGDLGSLPTKLKSVMSKLKKLLKYINLSTSRIQNHKRQTGESKSHDQKSK